jgi:uncharacterized membrane protein YphA (DoxX/SURF4 family)
MLPDVNALHHAVIPAARLFLATLFLTFSWRKVRDYSGTVSQMVQDGLPMPGMATAVSIFMELPVAFSVAVGAFTRPAALLMALYTLGTSLVEHRYWRWGGAGIVTTSVWEVTSSDDNRMQVERASGYQAVPSRAQNFRFADSSKVRVGVGPAR